jgi:RNA polymerase sigma factor (sigma-70 family)
MGAPSLGRSLKKIVGFWPSATLWWVNMTANDLDLLGQFTREQSQDAFTALVSRHLSLVYYAALRQVRSAHLAEEVSQAVFTNLACNAAKLKPDTILTAWLYQVACHTAIDVVRREARRQAREQIAVQMSATADRPADWSQIEPLLDEALQSLEGRDRAAVLLRYFENKSLREVGEALGASEDAAQKRVSRALDRMRDFFAQRKITVGAGALAALLSAHALQAVPASLVGTIATGAVAASTALSQSTAIAVTKTIAMTTLQKIGITALAAGALVVGVYQARQVSKLREQVLTLQVQQEEQVALSNRVQALQAERDRATNALAELAAESATRKKGTNEALKLRGEVGRLRQENAKLGASSPLSKLTATPEAREMVRGQQKFGMGLLYKGLAESAKLSTEQSDKLNNLLADHVMENVELITTMLRDKPPLEQIDQKFAAQDAALQEQVREMLGADGAARYQDYTKNLLSSLTADQFKSMLTGTDAEKADKSKQVGQIMQDSVQAAVAAAGLPADYQPLPILNFGNIASEQEGDRSLQLLQDIYQRASTGLNGVLSPEELTKFQEFQNTAIKNNRQVLSLNRTMMAPLSQ